MKVNKIVFTLAGAEKQKFYSNKQTLVSYLGLCSGSLHRNTFLIFS